MRTCLALFVVSVMAVFSLDSGPSVAQDAAKLKELKGIFNKAVAADKKGDHAESVRLFDEAVALAPKVFGGDHLNTAAILQSAGTVNQGAERYREAERLYHEALRIRELHLPKNDPAVADTLNRLGLTLERLAKYDEAEKCLLRCLAIQEPRKDSGLPATLSNLGVVCQSMARYEAAEQYYKRALAILEAAHGLEHPEVAGLMHNLSALYSDIGMYKQAEDLARRSLAIHEAVLGKDDPQVALNLGVLARICNAAGRAGEAEALDRRALKIRETRLGKNHPAVATTLNELAGDLASLGRYGDAELLFRRALSIRATGSADDRALASLLTNYGDLLTLLGRHQDAGKQLQSALTIYEAKLGKAHPQLARTLSSLAGLQGSKGNYQEAETFLLRAVAVEEQYYGKQNIKITAGLSNLAVVSVHLHKHQEAEKLLLRAIKIRVAYFGKDHPSVAVMHAGLANVHWVRRDYGKAVDSAHRALQIIDAHPGGDPAYRSAILRTLAHLHHAQGRTDEAMKLQEQALELDFAQLQGVLAFSSEAAMTDYVESRASILASVIAIAAAGPQDATAERALAWTLRLKGAAFDMLCRYRQAQHLLPQDERLARYRVQKAFLANAAVDPPAGVSTERVKKLIAEAEKEVNDLEAELNRTLAQKAPGLVAAPETVTVERVRKQLPKSGVLIEFVRVPVRDFKTLEYRADRYYAFVLTAGNEPPRLIDLGVAKDIDAGVEEIRKEFTDFQDALRECETADEVKTLEKTAEKQFAKKSAAVNARLMAPLEKALGAAAILILAPDGALNRLPFEALVDGQGKYLIERYSCVYVSSGRDLLRARAKPAEGIVVFAAPDYKLEAAERIAQAEKLLPMKAPPPLLAALPRRELRSAGWKPLPGARAEAGDIQKIFKNGKYGPVKAYVGPEALEEVLKAMPAPRILHLATHGFFLDQEPAAPSADDDNVGAGAVRKRLKRADNPLLRSGIVLAGANTVGDKDGPARAEDGWVTAEEIALLNLQGTELVVLSACQTGLGDIKTGAGVYGLRRAFLHAGARTLVTSLFEVPDAETRELMKRFYTGIADGAGARHALHSAQSAFLAERRQTRGAAHPFFWASFVFVGNPQ